MHGPGIRLWSAGMTVADGTQDDGRCAYPGCAEPRRPGSPGRSGPSPKFCVRPDHNPESARQARARVSGQRSTRVVDTAGTLGEDLPREGRVRQLVGRWAAATREAAVAAEAQAALLTAAVEALDEYRDEATVEARLAQARSDVDAAHAARLRAEEQARVAEQLRAQTEEARQAAERDAAAARDDAEQRIAEARADAEQRIAEARAEAAHRTALAEEARESAQAAPREAESGR